MEGEYALPLTIPLDRLPELDTRLQQEKAAVIAEIRAYPPPIPACDAQFNHLTEQRSRLMVALNRLQALSGSAPPASADASLALLRAIDDLHPDVQAELLAIIRQDH